MKPEEFNHRIVPMRKELKEYASRMTGDNDNAEDLVQEVMLKLWSMRSSLDAYDNIMSLATTILRNKYSDQWRRRQHEEKYKQLEWRHKRPVDGMSQMFGARTHVAAEPSEEDPKAEESDEMSLIRLIIEHLPPLQKHIFRLKEIEGYDSAEIMQITGCTAESLRQNLSRARKKIREDFIKLTMRRRKNDDTEH